MEASLRDYEVEVLRRHVREKRSTKSRPLFVFPCGGDESKHASRRRFREYIARSRHSGLQNVFCLTAEDIAKAGSMSKLNLLQQEAVLADICDWIVIFAESIGSFCELGAFSALPHAAAITSVAVDKDHKMDESFLNNGPVRELRDNASPLSQAFFLDQNNPFADASFASFVSSLRNSVRTYELSPMGDGRKNINLREGEVRVGSLVHELLDLLQIVGPCTEDELTDLYCRVKGFERASLRIKSTILLEDMRDGVRMSKIDMAAIVQTMIATGLVAYNKRGMLFSLVHLDSYFMFRNTGSADFNRMRSYVLLHKHHEGVDGHER